jgi:thiol-disulfide isomerase/thioredoxin
MLTRSVWTVALALAALYPVWGCSAAPPPTTRPSEPAVEVRTEPALDGTVVAFPRSGRVTLVDFWATSCEPCKQMMPAFESLWRQHRDEGLDVIGVASDDNPGLVIEELHRLGVSYPNVVDATAAVRGSYRVREVPHTVVIDRRGQVRLSLAGGKPDEVERIVGAVKAALEE